MEILNTGEIIAAIFTLVGFISLFIPVVSFRLKDIRDPFPQPETRFSIVVAFRNERCILPALYQSICHLNYPHQLIEWVVCNDHSEDDGKDWILNIQKIAPFKVIYCENTIYKGKKAALKTAVENTNFETLFFTDADCTLPSNLLNVLNDYVIKNDSLIISGPVKYQGNNTFLHHYQCMESAILMAITAHAFKRKKSLMANGANLCVKKTLFIEAQSARNDMRIPGGDDIFLLEYAMQKKQDACVFINSYENTVETLAEQTWKNLLNQRTRWASKVRFQRNINGKLWQLFSGIIATGYIASLILIPFAGWHLAAILVFGKMLADLVLMIYILPPFSYRITPGHIMVYSVIQVFIIIYTGIRSLTGHYYWKDRKH